MRKIGIIIAIVVIITLISAIVWINQKNEGIAKDSISVENTTIINTTIVNTTTNNVIINNTTMKNDIDEEYFEKNYIALISYSASDSIDAGTSYLYTIYPYQNGQYVYKKTGSSITIAGPGEERIIEQGIIHNKSELLYIEKAIQDYITKEKNKGPGIQAYIGYTYITENTWDRYESIEELANKLFP